MEAEPQQDGVETLEKDPRQPFPGNSAVGSLGHSVWSSLSSVQHSSRRAQS